MLAVLTERAMAKRNDVSVKMDEKVVEDCRIAASFKGLTLAEYLSETMRPIAGRDIDDGYARRSEPLGPADKGGKKGAAK